MWKEVFEMTQHRVVEHVSQVCRTNKPAERAAAFSQDRVRQSAVDQIAQGCANDHGDSAGSTGGDAS